MDTQSPRPPALSPNQLARREALIEAAMQVLRSHGLAGCTSRAIAEASPFAKSALHYYFRDTEEIVDLAFQRLMAQFAERIEQAAAAAPTPIEALWAAARTYVHLGSGQHAGQLPMLWFEVQLAASRMGDTSALQAITQRFVEVLTGLIDATGAVEPARTARVLLSCLVGILIRDALAPLALDDELEAAFATMGLATPAPAAREGAFA